MIALPKLPPIMTLEQIQNEMMQSRNVLVGNRTLRANLDLQRIMGKLPTREWQVEHLKLADTDRFHTTRLELLQARLALFARAAAHAGSGLTPKQPDTVETSKH